MDKDFVPYDYSNCDMPEQERLEHEWNDLMAEIAAAKRLRDATIESMDKHISFLEDLALLKHSQWLGE